MMPVIISLAGFELRGGGVALAISTLCACGQLLDLGRYASERPGAGGGAGGATSSATGIGGASDRVEWAKRYGDAASQVPSALGVSDNGAVVFSGLMQGTLDVDCGNCALTAAQEAPFLAAVDVGGNGLWAQLLPVAGPASIDSMWPVGETMWLAGSVSNTLTVSGTTLTSSNGDVFFAELDAMNMSLLSHDVPQESGAQKKATIAVNVFGEAALAGDDGEPSGLYVNMYDSMGASRWRKFLGSGADDTVHAVVLDAQRNVVLAGAVGGSVDFGCQSHPASDTDAYVVKLAYADGACLWSRTFGGPGEQRARSLAIDGAGNLLFSGHFEGGINFNQQTIFAEQSSIDGFIALLDQNGDEQWLIPSGGVGTEHVAAATFTADGRIAAVGDFDGELGFDDRQAFGGTVDGFAVVIEQDRTLRWSAQLEGGATQRLTAVVSRQQRLFALGEMDGGAVFEGWSLSNDGALPSIALACLVE